MENNQGLVALVVGAGFLWLLTRPQTQAVLRNLADRLVPARLVPVYHYAVPVQMQMPKRVSGVF